MLSVNYSYSQLFTPHITVHPVRTHMTHSGSADTFSVGDYDIECDDIDINMPAKHH